MARRSVVARGLQGPVEQKLLQSIVDATVSLFDAEASSIALFERAPDRLEYRVAAGEQGAGAVGLTVKPNEGIAGFVFSPCAACSFPVGLSLQPTARVKRRASPTRALVVMLGL